MKLNILLEKFQLHISKYVKYMLFKLMNNKYTPSDFIFIFSDGRGGGTWLMEILAASLNGLTLFEPFNGNSFNYTKRLENIDYPFITSNKKQLFDLKCFIRDVYKLKDPSVKTLQFNTLLKLLFHKKILVKVVNKNLILPWFINEFKPKHKPILLIRNPLDIIKSRANYGFKNMDRERNVNFSEIWNLSKNNPILREEDFLKSLNTNYEFYIAEWCLSLKPILNSEHYKKLVHLVDYEIFISNPKEIVTSIISSFGVEFDLNSINFKKKSASTFRLNQSIKPHKYLPNYEERVKRIFDHFQLMDYYNSICKSK